jgi:uncharacterized membrane protein
MSDDVLITVAVFGGIAVIIKIIADTLTRHRLIAKGMVDEKVKHLFIKDAQLHRLSSLKWGMVLVGIGVALVISQLAEDYITDESVFGLMFIFAGVAFLIYYGIARGHLNHPNELR